MQILDVNVLVYAHRRDMPGHEVCRDLIDALANGAVPFGVPEVVFSGVVRIVTQVKFNPLGTTEEALDFCEAVRRSPSCVPLTSGPSHWAVFSRLCRRINARGKLVADAYIAAFALDLGGEMVTADQDFAKFPGLKWRMPGSASATTNPI